MALKVRCASFVNPKGRQGKNKAASKGNPSPSFKRTN
jgi:hypothetical protein